MFDVLKGHVWCDEKIGYLAFFISLIWSEIIVNVIRLVIKLGFVLSFFNEIWNPRWQRRVVAVGGKFNILS